MRERVAAEGGTLWAGPTSDGGFTVWATLPVAAAPAAGPADEPQDVPADEPPDEPQDVPADEPQEVEGPVR
jgi:hypothetical protein